MLNKLFVTASVLLVLAGCDQMHRQESVNPYEQPKPEPVPGTVAANAPEPMPPLAEAYKLVNPLAADTATVAAGKQDYRYYCWQCHGKDLDGNSTVGPSFPAGRQNLLAPDVAKQTDGELFWKISNGSGWHPPLKSTMTVLERWRTVVYMRSRQAEKMNKETR